MPNREEACGCNNAIEALQRGVANLLITRLEGVEDVARLAAAWQDSTSLTALRLLLSEIGPDGAAHLALPASLAKLSLSGNMIGSDGAARLHLPASLSELDLRHNRIGPGGAARLALPASLTKLDRRASPN